MSDRSTLDWDPHSDTARADQIAAYDSMRRHCPVARGDALGWSLFRHADVMGALLAPGVFSNVVSARIYPASGFAQVPVVVRKRRDYTR